MPALNLFSQKLADSNKCITFAMQCTTMSKGDLVIRQTKKMATLKKDLIKTAKENNRDLSDYARLALKHAIENKLKF